MNKAIIIGNLTRDPEVRTTASGVSVCTFTVAVNRRFANQQGAREADYINVVTWRQLADLCGRYLAKGRKCAVVGSIQTRTYDAQDGSKRYATEVIADEVEFLSPANQNASQQADGAYAQNHTPPRQETGVQERFNPSEYMEVPNDDDLPF